MSAASEPAPRRGFEPLARSSPVLEAWAPIYWRAAPEAILIGLWLAKRHCNARGFVHGGVIGAVADVAMGLMLALTGAPIGEQGGFLTVSLAVDYLSVGKEGEWLEISPRLLKRGKTLGFTDCIITADATLIARSSATFKADLARPPADALARS